VLLREFNECLREDDRVAEGESERGRTLEMIGNGVDAGSTAPNRNVYRIAIFTALLAIPLLVTTSCCAPLGSDAGNVTLIW
jgi:hypothetical protein